MTKDNKTSIQKNTEKTIELEKVQRIAIKPQYKPIRHNDVLNELSQAMTIFTKYGQLDVNGNYTSQLDNKQPLALTLWEKPSGLEWLNNLKKEDLQRNLENIFNSVDQQTAKLLDVFIIKGTENGFNNTTITLDLKEYATILNGGETPTRSQINKAREKAKEGIEALKYIAYTYKKRGTNHLNVHLYGGTDGVSNGKIIFKFNEDFFKLNFIINNSSYLGIFPIKLLSIKENRHPHAYLLSKKLWATRRINRGNKARETTIKVKTLYDYVKTLPRAEKNNVRRATIIEPFERDLDAIANTGVLKWNYDKEYIDKQENKGNLTFDDWLNASIKVEWCNEYNLLDASIIEGKKAHKKKTTQKKNK